MSDLSEGLLADMAALWRRSQARRRDELLRLGWLIHEYVLERLRELDGTPAKGRQRRGDGRAPLVAEVADRLGASRARVRYLCHTALAYHLLATAEGPPAPPGPDVGFPTLRLFAPAAARRTELGPLRHGRSVSDCEEWVVRPGFEWAAGLLRRCLAEGWGFARAKAEFAAHSSRPGAVPAYHCAGGPVPDPLAAARAGSPRDVAELIENMVRRSNDPPETARLVCARLASVRPALTLA